jgi:hypothetical protein
MAELLLRLQLEMEAATAGAATAPSSQPTVFDQPGELPLPLGDEILPEILHGLSDDLEEFAAWAEAWSNLDPSSDWMVTHPNPATSRWLDDVDMLVNGTAL